MEETSPPRRQVAYNEEHGITPETIVKGVSDISELLSLESPTVPRRDAAAGRRRSRVCHARSSRSSSSPSRRRCSSRPRSSVRVRREAAGRDQGAAARAARSRRRLRSNHGRNIKTLHNFEPPATDDESPSFGACSTWRRVAARRVEGPMKPPSSAVDEVAHVTRHLLAELVTTAPPRDREVEAARARARAESSSAGTTKPKTRAALSDPRPASAPRVRPSDAGYAQSWEKPKMRVSLLRRASRCALRKPF